MVDSFIGFDSAWTDNPKAPGAICALIVEDQRAIAFHEPRLAGFEDALAFIAAAGRPLGASLIALDQSTIVPNATGMRPVERTAASLISWLGGGVQPSNRGRTGMFCDTAPIWTFLARLAPDEDPEAARTAMHGTHVIEVFPALALPSIDAAFFGRHAAPRYNPARRKTFRAIDWIRVAEAAGAAFAALGFADPARWCDRAASIDPPRKADQDRLDAMLCLLVALYWRLRPRSESMMLGCRERGYMILPASAPVRARLTGAAARYGVAIDGTILPPP